MKNVKNAMKVWVVLLLLCAAMITSPSPAHAGRVFLFAESAYLPTGSIGAKTQTPGSGFAISYTTIDCTDASTCTSHWPFAFPPDSGSSWAYRVAYLTDDTSAGVVCSWTINAMAYTDGGPYTFSSNNAATTANTSRSHLVSAIYYTNASTSTVVNKGNPGGFVSCTGSPSDCINLNSALLLTQDTAGTTLPGGAGKVCKAREIEVQY